jgi:hypothetical protein
VKLPSSLSILQTIPHSAAGGFVLFFVLGSATFLGLQHAASGPKQPIAFNHAKHIENGLTCTDCHTGVETQAKATLPTVETCMSCHQTALTASAEEAKVRSASEAGQELAWIQFTQVAPHVFFSHRRHVAVAHLKCAECHGPMEKATTPPDRPWRVLNMDACLSCHEQHRVNSDCNDCHR